MIIIRKKNNNNNNNNKISITLIQLCPKRFTNHPITTILLQLNLAYYKFDIVKGHKKRKKR